MTFEEYIKAHEPQLVTVTQQLWNPTNRSHIDSLRRMWDAARHTRDVEVDTLNLVNAALERALQGKQQIDIKFSLFGGRK